MDNKMNEILAPIFYPVFSASTISPIIGNSNEATKFRFLKKFKPFSELIPKYSKNDQKFKLSAEEKKNIMSNLDVKINDNNLEFNDQEIFEKFKKLSLSSKPQENLLDNDQSYSDDNADNLTETNVEKREDSEKKNISNAMRFISTRRGCKLEKPILDKLNEQRQNKFVQNKQKISKKFDNYEIVGIIDGICIEEKCILEIKTRNNLDMAKKTITKREQIQVIVYMNLHNSDKCLFVECDGNGQIKKTEILYDEAEFQKIIKSLQDFCNFGKSLTKAEFESLKAKYLK